MPIPTYPFCASPGTVFFPYNVLHTLFASVLLQDPRIAIHRKRSALLGLSQREIGASESSRFAMDDQLVRPQNFRIMCKHSGDKE